MRVAKRPEGRALWAAMGVLAVTACGPEVPKAGSGVKLPALGPSTLPLSSPSPSVAPSLAPASVAPSLRPSVAPSVAPSAGPSPVASATPAASGSVGLSVAVEARALGWRAGPDMRRARFGLVAAELDGQLLAMEGDVRPGLERLQAGGVWQLDEAYGPQGTGKVPWGWRFMAVASNATGLALLGGEQAGPTPLAATYKQGGPDQLNNRLSRPSVGAVGGANTAHAFLAGGESPRDESVGNQVFAYPWGASGLGPEEVRAPMPFAVAGAASAMVAGKLWVLGGYVRAEPGATAVPTTHVQVYDPTANTWQADGQASGPPALPQARQGGAACFMAGKLWLIGGAGAGGGLLPGVDTLVPGAAAWASGPALPTPRTLLAVAVFKDEAWAIGGVDGKKQALRSVEVLHP